MIFHEKISNKKALKFRVNIKQFTSSQFKELIKWLWVGLLNVSKSGDSWANKHQAKDLFRYRLFDDESEFENIL
jgi:hypothetical protein